MKNVLGKILYFKNHFVLLGIRFLGIISLFCSFRLINLKFGEELFGIFTLLVVFAQIGNLVGSFGIPVYVMKELSKLNSHERISTKTFSLIGDNSVSVLINSSIFCGILFLIYFLPLNIYPHSISFYSILCIIMSIPFMAQSNLNAQILRANNNTKEFQWLNGTLPFLFFSLFLGLVYFIELDDTYVFLLYLLSHILTFLTSYFLCKRNGVVFIFTKRMKNHFINNKLAFDYFSTQFISQAFNWTTIIVTSYMINDVDTGGINVITKYLSLAGLMIMVTNTYQGPNYTHLFHLNKIKELNNSISINTKFMVLITLPVIGILFLFPQFFLSIFSDDYIHLDLVFRIMLIGSIINLLCGSVGMLMQMTHQQKIYRNIMFSALIAHLILSLILSSLYGVVGLGVSLTLVLMYWNLISAYQLKRRHEIISYFNLKLK